MPDSQQLEFIQALLDPKVYSPPVEEVTLHETHISWVLLAGEFAYKVKKPVNLGFVDFSTLDRRKFFCHEELRLNRRLAKTLYLEVVPILGTPAAPRWTDAVSIQTDSETPFEYAVKMRRFPSETELIQVLARNELTPKHIDQLAQTIADFHATVAIAPVESPWGNPESVIGPVRENFCHLLSPSSPDAQRAAVAALESWSDCEFLRCRTEFARRKQAGFIRECHGDMHLGNMLLQEDRVVIFDCLEFNESLRWIDVQSEIAFLTMDLEDRGKPEFAHRLLNAYLEATGDYDGASLLPFYKTYRAVVRAKVAFLRAEQSQHTGNREELDKSLQEAASYLQIAQGYTKPASPILFVTHGLSGSGKTHATQSIVEDFAAVRLRSDVERKRIAGLAPAASSRSEIGGGLYSAELTHRTYVRLKNLATRLLQAGKSVIIDATNLKQQQRTLFRDLAGQLGIQHLILEFHAPVAILRQRVQQRQQAGHDASEATVAVLEQQLQQIEPLDEAERLETVTLDTSEPYTDSRLREKLSARLR